MASDPNHAERRLEGGRQLNIQLAAARSGTAVPKIDPSIVREDSFLPRNANGSSANPLDRYLQVQPQDDATVLFSRTATQNELKARGILRK